MTEPPQGALEELNSKLRLAGPALASDIARLVGELQTREYSKGKREGYRIGLVEGHMDNEAYQAGLSAALGALPESRSGEGSTRSFDFCAGFNAATDQARRNIEKLKEPSNEAEKKRGAGWVGEYEDAPYGQEEEPFDFDGEYRA